MVNFSLPAGRYLITGGAGFIGSHLGDFLVEHASTVVAIDNFITGSQENIRTLRAHKAFEVIEHNIIQPLRLSGELAGIFQALR